MMWSSWTSLSPSVDTCWSASILKGGLQIFCILLFLQLADVWSCGVTLYVMLVGAYPFEDQDDPKNFRKTITVRLSLSLSKKKKPYYCLLGFTLPCVTVLLQRIMAVQYNIPEYVHISQDCRHLLSRIFVANPARVWLNFKITAWFVSKVYL